jgi:flagellar basal-body rod protein FlgF
MKETLSMVLDYGNFRVKDNGPIKRTGNPLDVALQGQGFMGVQGPGGKVMYTRNGTFTMDSERKLVTAQGYPVVDSGGQPISIPDGQGDIVIDQQGGISVGDSNIGSLMIQDFPNLQSLKPVGDSLYEATDPGTPSTDTKVVQGALEGSNTQGVLEMTDMIEVSRNYQSVARMLQTEHDRLRSTIRTMTENS